MQIVEIKNWRIRSILNEGRFACDTGCVPNLRSQRNLRFEASCVIHCEVHSVNIVVILFSMHIALNRKPVENLSSKIFNSNKALLGALQTKGMLTEAFRIFYKQQEMHLLNTSKWPMALAQYWFGPMSIAVYLATSSLIQHEHCNSRWGGIGSPTIRSRIPKFTIFKLDPTKCFCILQETPVFFKR